MIQNYQDEMAICRCCGYPNLFITFTRNPKWPEISRFVESRGLKAKDRPDIICQIFKVKLDNLIKDFKQNKLLSTMKASRLISTIYILSFSFIFIFTLLFIFYISNECAVVQLFTLWSFKKVGCLMHIYCSFHLRKIKYPRHKILTRLFLEIRSSSRSRVFDPWTMWYCKTDITMYG